MLPVAGAEQWAGMSNVAERPEPLVGKPVVIPLLFFFRQPHSPQDISRIIGRDQQPVIGVHHVHISVAGPVRDPGPVTGAQHRFHRSNQAARGNVDFDVFAAAHVQVGFAVRNHEKPPLLQPGANVHRQPIRRPHGLSRLAQPSFQLGSRASDVQTLGESRDLPCQRTKHLQIRQFDPPHSTTGAQRLHPVGGSGNRSSNAPAHNQQGDQDDQKNMR